MTLHTTKLPNSEQYSKGKVKTHKYIKKTFYWHCLFENLFSVKWYRSLIFLYFVYIYMYRETYMTAFVYTRIQFVTWIKTDTPGHPVSSQLKRYAIKSCLPRCAKIRYTCTMQFCATYIQHCHLILFNSCLMYVSFCMS
jgi:hypothetical protein